MANPFQYTDKTFERVLNSINSNAELVDKPNWFKDMAAGIADIAALWNNAAANNTLLGTAYTRRNVSLLLALIDYNLAAQTTSQTPLIFYLKSVVSFPVTFTAAEMAALTPGTVAISSQKFEARTANTISSQETDIFQAVDVNTGTDEITTVREFQTGEKIQLTTTGTLPAPLQTGTDYYIIRIDATTIKIATSITNAFSDTNVDITTAGTGVQTILLFSFIQDCFQQTTISNSSIGQSDGTTEFQKFNLPDLNILSESLVVTINSVNWTQQTTLVDSQPADTDYRFFYNSDQSSFIQVGDGTYGAIPPANFDIAVTYAVGGGSISNVTQLNRINIYAGTASDIEGVTNYTTAVGGANPQSIEQGKVLGPLLLKTRDRFVTTTDGEAIALSFGGISLSKIVKNAFGLLSAKSVNVPNGGGNLSGSVKTQLEQYLIDRTVLESIDVRVEDATYITENVNSDAKMLPGFNWTGEVENYFRLAWKLFFTETGQEILLVYNSDGINAAIEIINTNLSESFTSADINQITKLLNNLIARNFGDAIQETDSIVYIQGSVDGIDYMTIAAPVFPIALSSEEITTPGTMTIAEIL